MLAVQYRNIKHIPSSFSSVCLSVCRCRSFLYWDFEQIQTLWSGAERGWFHMQHQQGVWSRLAPQRWGLLLDSLLIQTCLLWEHGSDPYQPFWILMSSTMPPVTQCMPERDTCLFIPPRMPFSRSCWAIKDMSALASLSLSSVMSLSFLKEQDKRFQQAEVWRVSSLTLICIWRAGQVVLKSTSNYRPVQVSWSAVELGDDLRCNHTRKSVHISAHSTACWERETEQRWADNVWQV